MAPVNATSVTFTLCVCVWGDSLRRSWCYLLPVNCYVKYLCEVRSPMKNGIIWVLLRRVCNNNKKKIPICSLECFCCQHSNNWDKLCFVAVSFFFKSMQVYFKEIMTPTLWTMLVSIPVAESGPSVMVDTATYMGDCCFSTRKGDLRDTTQHLRTANPNTRVTKFGFDRSNLSWAAGRF